MLTPALSRRVAAALTSPYALDNLKVDDRDELARACQEAETWDRLPPKWRTVVLACERSQARGRPD